jgi:micrococcal nuclease
MATASRSRSPSRTRRRSPVRILSALLNISPILVAAVFTILGGGTLLRADGSARTPPTTASFSYCPRGGEDNCVVDGDTLHINGTTVRVADIDTPETNQPQCISEAALGAEATEEMLRLVNAGPFTVEPYGREQDIYGRKLRLLMRDGRSLGQMLVAKGLARTWDGSRHSWCQT